jgi:hypothetical protein
LNSFKKWTLTFAIVTTALPRSLALAQSNSEDRASAETNGDGFASKDVEGNPKPPSGDKLKRVRAVPLPGQGKLRTEKTGQVRTEEDSSEAEDLFARGRNTNGNANSLISGNVKKPFNTTRFPPRFVYLNGKNISALKDEVLENVTVRIDSQGNINISAPHYEVQEQTSFHPLLPSELPKFPKRRLQPNFEDRDGAESVFSKKNSDWASDKKSTSNQKNLDIPFQEPPLPTDQQKLAPKEPSSQERSKELQIPMQTQRINLNGPENAETDEVQRAARATDVTN